MNNNNTIVHYGFPPVSHLLLEASLRFQTWKKNETSQLLKHVKKCGKLISKCI